jgi:hypothetical protein
MKNQKVGRGLTDRQASECTGVPHLQEIATPYDPTECLCLGSYGGPRGWAFSYKRGTPACTRIMTRMIGRGLTDRQSSGLLDLSSYLIRVPNQSC